MAKTTSDSILGVIWKFELVLTRRAVNMQIRETAKYAKCGNATWRTTWHWQRFAVSVTFLVSV